MISQFGAFMLKTDAIGIDHVDALHEVREHALHVARRVGAQRDLVAELDVLGGEVAAVVEFHALAQIERPALAVLRLLPLHGQARRGLTGLVVALEQRVEDRDDAIAFACGRAGTSQSSAPSDESPMTTVPSGAASAPPETPTIAAAKHASSSLLIFLMWLSFPRRVATGGRPRVDVPGTSFLTI
jgi:hypothetical protein